MNEILAEVFQDSTPAQLEPLNDCGLDDLSVTVSNMILYPVYYI